MVKQTNEDSYFFIKRPVLATVISLIITIIGLVSLLVLPVEQYPKVLPVQVKVNASYPGASPEVIATTVAAPLEQAINGVNNMLYIESVSSSSGALIVTITFDMSVDPDIAQVNVNNRVQSVLPFLPQSVRDLGVTVNKASSSILEVITISSDNPVQDTLFLNNYTAINIIDELKRLDGIEDAELFGDMEYSMRIWLKADSMSTYNISVNEIIAAIREQNSQYPIGKIGAEPMAETFAFTYNINAKGRYSTVEEFENIIIRNSEGETSSLKLKDVARIELGSKFYGFRANLNNKPTVAVGIFLQDGANSLKTAAAVKDKMDSLAKSFPEGMNYKIPYDTTKFVKISIEEVVVTLFEAIGLVIVIVFLFIQNVRATMIALIAIPISLIGTAAGMYFLGFSINLLTLFGIILAIGIVVDDAIVVIENVDYRMKKLNLSGKDAAIQAMKEVRWPIVTISLVLCMVFLPVSFIGGLVGVMYRQFAITIAVSVMLSAIVSLSLTPVMCSIFLKGKQEDKNTGGFFTKFNKYFDYITDIYIKGVEFLLKHIGFGLTIFACIVIATIYMARSLPTALLPEEDQGYLISTPFLMPGSSFARSDETFKDISSQLLAGKNVESVISLVGYDILSSTLKTNTGTLFIVLKDWDERKSAQDDARVLVGKYMFELAGNKEAIVPVFNPPPIVGMSTTGGFEAYLQYKGSSSDVSILNDNLAKFVKAANARPELKGVMSTFSYNSPQYYLSIDNENVKSLGINISDVFLALKSNLGGEYVNDFTLYGRNYRVYLLAESSLRKSPDDIKNISVKSNNGKMVSLASLVDIKRGVGTDEIDRFNLFPSAKIMGAPAPGYSLGQALETMQEVAAADLSADFSIGFTGEAYEQLNTSNTSTYVLLFGVVMVFLILAALYERWSLPFAVIFIIPIAIFGALVFTFLRGLYNDIYFQVGLLTLIGLSSKNAILIVEFAMLEYHKGVAIHQAIITATRMRFRAIVMTSAAFILGCVPLYTSTGAGSASRHAVGTGVIGGMLASTFIATFFVPLFFKLIMQLSEKFHTFKKSGEANV